MASPAAADHKWDADFCTKTHRRGSPTSATGRHHSADRPDRCALADDRPGTVSCTERRVGARSHRLRRGRPQGVRLRLVTEIRQAGQGCRGTVRGTSTGRIPVHCVRSGQILGTLVQVERAVRPSSPLLIRGFGVRVPGGAPVLTWAIPKFRKLAYGPGLQLGCICRNLRSGTCTCDARSLMVNRSSQSTVALHMGTAR